MFGLASDGDGADVVIEAVGAPATFTQAIDIVCFCGRVVYIGYCKAPVAYDTKFFNLKELDIMGSRYATAEDFRAVIACCLPLTVGTFIGYWFMKELQIGLTVATLPVMVLAVGIGVDYAFYIYNRLQFHLAHGQPIVKAVEHAIMEVGMATIFTAITLAVGVATWSFSALKFQADMGKLLAFMFIVNLIMAMTALPALAVWMDKIFPRRSPVKAPGILDH